MNKQGADAHHKAFVENAQRTASDIFNEENLSDYFFLLLEDFIHLGNKLDSFKKNIFYNRPLPEEIQADVNYCFTKHLDGMNPSVNPKIVHGILGKATEIVELLELLLSYWKSEANELDVVNLLEEMGDDDWYNAEIWTALWNDFGVKATESDVRELIIEKLRDRFPDRFDAEDANNRDLGKERRTLESILNNGNNRKQEGDNEEVG